MNVGFDFSCFSMEFGYNTIQYENNYSCFPIVHYFSFHFLQSFPDSLFLLRLKLFLFVHGRRPCKKKQDIFWLVAFIFLRISTILQKQSWVPVWGFVIRTTACSFLLVNSCWLSWFLKFFSQLGLFFVIYIIKSPQYSKSS